MIKIKIRKSLCEQVDQNLTPVLPGRARRKGFGATSYSNLGPPLNDRGNFQEIPLNHMADSIDDSLHDDMKYAFKIIQKIITDPALSQEEAKLFKEEIMSILNGGSFPWE